MDLPSPPQSSELETLLRTYNQSMGKLFHVLGMLVFAAGMLIYELVREPPELLEFYGVYEGMVDYTHQGLNGKTYSAKYMKVQGMDLPIRPIDGWDRLMRMKHNRLVHFVVELPPKTRWFSEPAQYYEAVAIKANIPIYDHRHDRDERLWRRLKNLLLAIAALGVLSLIARKLLREDMEELRAKDAAAASGVDAGSSNSPAR